MLLLLSALIALCTLAIQTHPIFRYLGPSGHVDLSLLLVVSFTLLWGGQRAIVFGFIIGLIHDTLSSEWLGLNALSKCLVVFVISMLARQTQSNNPIVQGIFAATASLLDASIRLVLLTLLQSHSLAPLRALHTVLLHTLLALIITPCICAALRALAQTLHIQPEKGSGNVSF